MIQKADIKRRIMDHQFGATHERQEVLSNIDETRFIAQKFARDAMHFYRTGIDFAVRLQILMKVISAQPAIDQFDATNFNDAMTVGGFEPGGFCVKNNLSHRSRHWY